MVLRSGELTVIGEGTTSAALDLVTLSVGVLTTSASAAQLLRDNASRILAVAQALVAAGVPQGDIQASGLNLIPQMAQPGSGDGSLVVGYHATAALNVTLSEANRTGEILDAAIRAGANYNIGVVLKLKDVEAAQRAALAAAAHNARCKAEALAAATGKQIGDALAVAEEMNTAVLGGTATNFSIMPVLPGEVSVRMRVRVTYDLL